MDERKIETFDLGLGKVDAHKVTELEYNEEGKLRPRTYIEVFPAGVTEPDELIAWFGDVESFAKWIGESKTNF